MGAESRFKKGEVLFSEGDSLDKVFIIQSGRVSLNIIRSGRSVELDVVGPTQILGEQAVTGNGKATFNAVALSEVKVVALPSSVVKDQVDKGAGSVKLILKSMGDEVKKIMSTVRSYVLEADTAPCPQKLVARVFTLLNLVARHSGELFEVEGSDVPLVHVMGGAKIEARWSKSGLVLKWPIVRVFASRMFLESPNRILGALELLSKFGYASLYWEKSEDEEAEMELVEVCIHDVDFIEQFAEFYQYNYFKGGKAEIIYFDSMALKVAQALIDQGEQEVPDRRGTVQLEYQGMLKGINERSKFELNSNHLSNLEKKGLFVKRTTRDEGVYLSFDINEFKMVTKFWQVISEIDKWNQVGYVDMSEESQILSKDGKPLCPDCETELSGEEKFCMECGCKLQMVA